MRVCAGKVSFSPRQFRLVAKKATIWWIVFSSTLPPVGFLGGAGVGRVGRVSTVSVLALGRLGIQPRLRVVFLHCRERQCQVFVLPRYGRWCKCTRTARAIAGFCCRLESRGIYCTSPSPLLKGGVIYPWLFCVLVFPALPSGTPLPSPPFCFFLRHLVIVRIESKLLSNGNTRLFYG